jgi:Putative peptidoglycan binding domain
MRRFVFLTCMGSLALALTALGAPKERQATKSPKAKGAPSAHAVSGKAGAHVAHARAPRVGTHSVARANSVRGNRVDAARMRSARNINRPTAAGTVARNRTALNRERNVARANALQVNRNESARIRSARANARIARNNLAFNRQRNLTMARNVAINRGANARVVNNWRNARFRGSNYAAFYHYNRQWHDRAWWTSHYSQVVYVMGGWWYWNAGYWYPAWGYAPYAYYPYDGPIYGYGGLAPDRIVENVQVALQRDGYYAGPIDGDLGPQMRGALAAFQADHGLAVTSAVDRPTLQTLGLA